jgi:hypothetical protein
MNVEPHIAGTRNGQQGDVGGTDIWGGPGLMPSPTSPRDTARDDALDRVPWAPGCDGTKRPTTLCAKVPAVLWRQFLIYPSSHIVKNRA